MVQPKAGSDEKSKNLTSTSDTIHCTVSVAIETVEKECTEGRSEKHDDILDHQEFFSGKLIERTGSTSTPIIQKTQSRVDVSASITCTTQETNDSGFTEVSTLLQSKNEESVTETVFTSKPPKSADSHNSTESDSVIEKTQNNLHQDSCTDAKKDKREVFLEKLNIYLAELEEKCPSNMRIGINIGEEYLDIVTQLHQKQIPCLSTIFQLLSDDDLRSCQNVSKSWKDIVASHSACKERLEAAQLCRSQQGPESLKNKVSDSTTELLRSTCDS